MNQRAHNGPITARLTAGDANGAPIEPASGPPIVPVRAAGAVVGNRHTRRAAAARARIDGARGARKARALLAELARARGGER